MGIALEKAESPWKQYTARLETTGEERKMLRLTKFTGEEFWLNPDALTAVEECGDTIVTLNSGERMLVKEKALEIRHQFITYKRQIQAGHPITHESEPARELLPNSC